MAAQDETLKNNHQPRGDTEAGPQPGTKSEHGRVPQWQDPEEKELSYAQTWISLVPGLYTSLKPVWRVLLSCNPRLKPV